MARPLASERTRARLTSLYGILPASGYALGAGIYVLVGYRGYAPFFAGSAAMVLGIVPVLFITMEAADIVLGGPERLRHAFRRAPLLLTTAFLAGVLEMVPWSLERFHLRLRLRRPPRVATSRRVAADRPQVQLTVMTNKGELSGSRRRLCQRGYDRFQSNPASANEKHAPSPTMKWSSKRMSTSASASRKRRVTYSSA